MTTDNEKAQQLATSARLTKVDQKQLAAAVASARTLTARLPRDLHWSEEIALAFRLPTPGSAKR
jgi:hypothetical protein